MSTSVASTPLLASLSELGPPSPGDGRTYVSELGLATDDVPALLEVARMWADPSHFERFDGSAALWAPIHAWRALAELRAEAVVPTLLAMLDTLDEQGDDWYLELFPRICARIGSPAIAALEHHVLDESHHEYARVSAAHGLAAIAETDPATRDHVVEVLATGLERLDGMVVDLNGFLVSYLTDLGAVERAESIERAFDAGVVNVVVCGDWPHIAYELGLGPAPTPRRPRWELPVPTALAPTPAVAPSGRGKKTDKAARKREKHSRRKNRRK